MKSLIAFIKKELMELFRTGKMTILLIIFLLFGVMSPAIAKLTPWIMDLYSESLAENGMIIGDVTVNALTSWTQFYKNIPLALIVYVILFSSILTNEYQKGTLINLLTKGLKRWKIISSKVLVCILFWTICYFLCYVITYAYTVYFWDNKIANHPFISALYPYVFGIWCISLIFLMSTLFHSNTAVLAATGAVAMISYLLEMIPDLSHYMPTKLLSSSNICMGNAALSDYTKALIVTLLLFLMILTISILHFNRKME